MDEAEWAELGKHLKPLREVLIAFGRNYGFEYSRTGLYPRVKLRRQDVIVYWFDFMMSLDSDGMYRQEFTESVPYDLCAGAFYDVHHSYNTMTRYAIDFVILDSVPFSSITPESLEGALEQNLDRVLGITTEQLMRDGESEHMERNLESRRRGTKPINA